MSVVKYHCLNCGSETEAPLKEIKRGNGKYCSRQCFHKHRSKLAKLKVREPNCKCGWCDRSFYRPPSKIKASKSGLLFCDKQCRNLAQRIGGCKEIQPNHYGNIKPNYRRDALEAKGCKCERCGFNDYRAIVVHHQDRNRSNNDISNLEVLCCNCHAIEHDLCKNLWTARDSNS